MIKDGRIPYDPNKPFYRQTKLWAMFIGVLVPVLNHFMGWGMDPNTVWQIVGPLATYIGARGAIDATH